MCLSLSRRTPGPAEFVYLVLLDLRPKNRDFFAFGVCDMFSHEISGH